MPKVVIKARNIGKKFRVGNRRRCNTLRETIIETFYHKRKIETVENSIWALKGIDLEIEQGEVVGIIGHNGAGKSTLLKILSKITEPTEGRVEMCGRVGSLLEVGTGFHPELTGRENIYLNGAILGMRRNEIKQRFDEIVAFSEVERFVDTPVKHYSSGMYTRLAFAVAAHLDTEILLVDEVLAVGDVQFQSKCLGKMSDISKKGRTVLYVSHNMASVNALCNSGIFLLNGQVNHSSKTNINEVISKYLQFINSYNTDINLRTDRNGNGILKVTNIRFEGYETSTLITGKPVVLCLSYSAQELLSNLKIHISIRNNLDQIIFFFDTELLDYAIVIVKKTGAFKVEIPNNLCLTKGTYYLNYTIYSNDEMVDNLTKAYFFDVVDGPFFPNGKSPNLQPIINVEQRWYVE